VVFAGPLDEEGDNKEDSQDRNDIGEAYFPPSDFEWQPNPVIFSYLQTEHLQSPNSSPSVAKDILDCYLVNTAGAAERFCPDTTVNFDDKSIPNNNQESPSAPRHTGPTTMSANLSSFACSQCTHVAKKKCTLRYAIISYLEFAYAK
jgi:hypothetical protein